eukprot:11285985-Karenia_brevis.AAC.1
MACLTLAMMSFSVAEATCEKMRKVEWTPVVISLSAAISACKKGRQWHQAFGCSMRRTGRA